MVSDEIFITVLTAVGGAVAWNRKKINGVRQRLFGHPRDESDLGHIQEMDQRLKRMHAEMNEQHGEVYEKLEEMQGENDG